MTGQFTTLFNVCSFCSPHFSTVVALPSVIHACCTSPLMSA